LLLWKRGKPLDPGGSAAMALEWRRSTAAPSRRHGMFAVVTGEAGGEIAGTIPCPCEEEMLASASWKKTGHEEGWAAPPLHFRRRRFGSRRQDGLYIAVYCLLASNQITGLQISPVTNAQGVWVELRFQGVSNLLLYYCCNMCSSRETQSANGWREQVETGT
jgi:hypothetical protein